MTAVSLLVFRGIPRGNARKMLAAHSLYSRRPWARHHRDPSGRWAGLHGVSHGNPAIGKPGEPSAEACVRARASDGAEERTRTFTPLRELAPETFGTWEHTGSERCLPSWSDADGGTRRRTRRVYSHLFAHRAVSVRAGASIGFFDFLCKGRNRHATPALGTRSFRLEAQPREERKKLVV